MISVRKKGSILVEGLIVMTIINIMVMLIFSYIRFIQTNYTERIHQERATLLLTETFEKLRSARDTEMNINKKTGWDAFIRNISADKPEALYSLVEVSDPLGKIEIVPEQKGNVLNFSSDIAPYADYRTQIHASFDKEEDGKTNNTNKVIFDVIVRWRNTEETDTDISDLSYVRQSLMLTNHSIYENLF